MQLYAELDSGTWRDQLLADIEEHIAELNGRLTRFAVFRSLQPSIGATGTSDEAVFERMHQSLHDTAAAALAFEMAYYEAFTWKPGTAHQYLIAETDQRPKSGATG
jgi:hypothetical protein